MSIQKKDRRTKCFTLISQSLDGWMWEICTAILPNGSFAGKGLIKIYDRKEKYRKNRKKEIKRSQKYYLKNRESIRKKRKESYQKNREKYSFDSKKYRELHKDKSLETNRKSYIKNREQILIACKNKREANKEEFLEREREYYKKHREYYIEKANKRNRELEVEKINSFFVGAEAHHMDKELVVYIPRKLHRSIYHNVFSGKGMDEINGKVLVWFGKKMFIKKKH